MALKVRKNNVGRAIIRFVVGLVLLAAVVFILTKVVNKDHGVQPDKTANNITADQTVSTPSGELVFGEPLSAETDTDAASEGSIPEDNSGEGELLPDENELIGDDTDVFGEDEPEDFTDYEPEDLFGDEPEDIIDIEPVATPEPEPTPTPVPTATPVPASMYATPNLQLASKYPWKFSTGHVYNGISQLDILSSETGGNVISMTGWTYANHAGFNGKDSTIYVIVMNEAGFQVFYPVTISAGATGIEHTGAANSKNLNRADFTLCIDVTAYPDGKYRMGSAIRYTIGKNTYSYGFTFGDAYDFTVQSGIITAMGGVEN